MPQSRIGRVWGRDRPESKSKLHPLPAVRLWASHITSFSPSFVISKVSIITSPTRLLGAVNESIYVKFLTEAFIFSGISINICWSKVEEWLIFPNKAVSLRTGVAIVLPFNHFSMESLPGSIMIPTPQWVLLAQWILLKVVLSFDDAVSSSTVGEQFLCLACRCRGRERFRCVA